MFSDWYLLSSHKIAQLWFSIWQELGLWDLCMCCLLLIFCRPGSRSIPWTQNCHGPSFLVIECRRWSGASKPAAANEKRLSFKGWSWCPTNTSSFSTWQSVPEPALLSVLSSLQDLFPYDRLIGAFLRFFYFSVPTRESQSRHLLCSKLFLFSPE